MKIKLFALYVLVLSGISFGCATVLPQVESEEGRELVGRILSAYEEYDDRNFNQFLSENLYPLSLDNRIEANSYKERDVSYTFSVNHLSQTKKELNIVFQWEKIRYSLVYLRKAKLYGTTHFVFMSEDGEWKLQRVLGDNPFVN